MKPLLYILLLLTASQALAYPCPADLESVRDKATLHGWLSQIQGIHNLTGCTVEITACNPEEARSDSQTLAEIYIIGRRGREAYLPLNIAEKGDQRLKTVLRTYPRTLNYKKWDYFFEKEYGEVETYKFEVTFKKPGSLEVESMDLGTYATNKALNRPDGSKARWYNCGASAE